MKANHFVPRGEKLESKLLLSLSAVLAGPEYFPAETQSPQPAADVSKPVKATSGIEAPGITWMEHEGGESFVVIQLADPPDDPCTVCIVGGESAKVRADGTARLRLPQKAGIIDLTIGAEGEAQKPLLRLELEAGGHILKQTWLRSEAVSETISAPTELANDARFVISSDHAVHSMALSSVNVDQVSHGHLGIATNGAETYEQAVATVAGHHAQMADAPQLSSASHFSSGHGNDVQRSMDSDSNMQSAGSTDHAAVDEVVGAAPHIASQIAGIPVEEDIEEILANWVAGEEEFGDGSISEAVVAMLTHRSPQIQSSAQLEQIVANVPATAVAQIAIVSHSSEGIPSSGSDESSSSSLQIFGAIAIAAIAAGGAYALERRANARKNVDNQHMDVALAFA